MKMPSWMPVRWDDWRVFAATLLVAFVCILIIREWAMVPVLLALLGLYAWYMRAEWWPQASAWFKTLRGRFIRIADTAPSYWEGPPTNADHLGYREDYELLVSKPGSLTRSELLQLAEVFGALQNYGDRPLAKPPAVQARRSFFGGAAGGVFSQWTWIVGALLVAVIVGQWGWAKSLEASRDAACSAGELRGHTSREPCRDLAEAGNALSELTVQVEELATARAGNVGSQVTQERETAALNRRRAQREAAAAERLRRARDDDEASARDARAPDWDQRLRDVATPLPILGESPAGAGPGASAAGGVPGGAGPGPEPVRPADPADGAGGPDGSVGQPGSGDSVGGPAVTVP